MGTDKARLRLGGRTWWEHQCATLRRLDLRERYVVAPYPPSWLPSDFRWAPDHPGFTGDGPLTGFAGLAALLRAPACVVLGIDLPLLRADTLLAFEQATSADSGWIPVAGDRLQPFAACYPANLLEQAQPLLENGERRIMALVNLGLESGQLRKIEVERSAELEFLNGNSPETLRQMARAYEDRTREEAPG